MKTRIGKTWLSAVIVATILTVFTGSAAANPLEKLDTAVNMVPADAAFYSSMLRGREQVEAVASSKAWKKLLEIPLVQMGLQFYEVQTASEESVPGKIDKALKDPQVQEILAVLGDMFSDEVFIYAGPGVVDTVELLQQLNNVNRFSPIMQHLGGEDGDLDQQQAKAKMVLAVLAKNPEKLKVPNVIMGFKIDDAQRAAAQLDKLDVIAGIALAQNPDLADVYKRLELGKDSFSTYTLSGGMIPWDELPLDRLGNIETDPGDLQKVVEQVKKQKLVVAFGLRGDYLLVAIGPSTEALAALGKGERLVNRPEIERLGQFADKPVTGIGYVSEQFNRLIAGSREDIDELLAVVDEILPASGLPEDVQAQIRKDAAALAEDIKPFMPQPGAVSAINFLCEQGSEQYCFDWGKYPQLDGSQPLSLLQHVGGSPLLAAVGRGKVSPENYDLLSKWVRIGYGYVEKFALPQMDQPDREKFDKLAEAMKPLVERLDRINREKLLPALADGQCGLVVDAKLTTKQIHEALPAMEKPMPMIEPAVVIGISDAVSFREAVTQYWELLGDTAKVLSETLPDKPEIPLPAPQTQQTEAGEIFSIELPRQVGLDEQIGLYLGLNETVAVFCLNEAQAKRLLADTKPAVGGVLADANRPRARAIAFDWPATLKAAMPWVEMGVMQAASRFAGREDIQAQFGAIQPQLATLAEVLSCIRSITSESYFQDGVLVTHTMTEISDIE